MKTAQFTNLIQQNVVPKSAEKIVVLSRKGRHICDISFGNLAMPSTGEFLYRKGVLSDVHVSQDTAETDFRNALTYFQDTAKVDFVCIAGDLTQYSYDDEWELYKTCVEEESENTPIYAILGNHDGYGRTITNALSQELIGHDVFYTFTQDDDVYIMMSNACYPSESGNLQPFYTESLQSLYETLEANRNKRCFVYQHYVLVGLAGDPADIYDSTTLFGTQETVIRSLMGHYPNSIWFHGHTHHDFESQLAHEKSNYDFDCGCHNIHIPSCYMPIRVSLVDGEYTRSDLIDGSQGYVVDVYENGIHLQGVDFTTGEFVGIASYWLDTTLVEVEAGTYTDSTGTITT